MTETKQQAIHPAPRSQITHNDSNESEYDEHHNPKVQQKHRIRK
jgi:hypothetical protein